MSSTTQPPSLSQTHLSLSSNLPQNPSRAHHCRRPIKEPTIAGSLTPPRRRRPLRTAWRVHVLPVEEEREEAVRPCLAAAAHCRRPSSTGSQVGRRPPLPNPPNKRNPNPHFVSPQNRAPPPPFLNPAAIYRRRPLPSLHLQTTVVHCRSCHSSR
ncbi:hypothetical protein PIB30_045400 [Stylosanthes scabra]|uniref:Uncharacterized protein n=1 Tax=Stylosanthes scabra TaxID=79078 RepID=A0ABU6WH49_9FABA|nr:hypothetical protein [Stylosanthes scabra]